MDALSHLCQLELPLAASTLARAYFFFQQLQQGHELHQQQHSLPERVVEDFEPNMLAITLETQHAKKRSPVTSIIAHELASQLLHGIGSDVVRSTRSSHRVMGTGADLKDMTFGESPADTCKRAQNAFIQKLFQLAEAFRLFWLRPNGGQRVSVRAMLYKSSVPWSIPACLRVIFESLPDSDSMLLLRYLNDTRHTIMWRPYEPSPGKVLRWLRPLFGERDPIQKLLSRSRTRKFSRYVMLIGTTVRGVSRHHVESSRFRLHGKSLATVELEGMVLPSVVYPWASFETLLSFASDDSWYYSGESHSVPIMSSSMIQIAQIASFSEVIGADLVTGWLRQNPLLTGSPMERTREEALDERKRRLKQLIAQNQWQQISSQTDARKMIKEALNGASIGMTYGADLVAGFDQDAVADARERSIRAALAAPFTNDDTKEIYALPSRPTIASPVGGSTSASYSANSLLADPGLTASVDKEASLTYSVRSSLAGGVPVRFF